MIFYITTHDGNYEAASKIKSLFENKNVAYYFVYGKNSTKKVEPSLEVDVDEAYENLPLKTYFLIEHFLKNTEENVLVKMDDDTFVDVDKILNNTHEEDYVGLFVKYTKSLKNSIYHWYKIKTESYKIQKPSFDLSYAEGSLYFLNRKAAQAVYNFGYDFFVNVPEQYIGEDIKVGMCLPESEFSRKDITKPWIPFYEISTDFSFIHPVHPFLIDKLKTCNSIEEQLVYLNKFKFLNDNIKREIYLNKELSKFSNEKSISISTTP
jgi:hypothetical protein